MRDFIEDNAEDILVSILGIIALVAIVAGMAMMVSNDLHQSCADAGATYEHGACVYHWNR